MNVQPNYTLASQPQTRPAVARLGVAVARHLFHRDLSHRCRADRGDVVRSPASPITSSPTATSTRFRAVVQVGLLAASIFTISNVFRGEYRLPNFFAFKPHARPHHPIVERHADLPADARLPGAGQRRLFARLDRAVLFRDARRPRRFRALPSCASPRWRAPPGCFGAAHLPDRHRRAYRRLRPALRAVGARAHHRRLPLPHPGAGHRIGRSPPRRARSRPCRGRRQRAQPRARRDLFCCCRGRRPRPSTAAPRPFWRCRSKSISVPSRSCTSSTRSNSPRSGRWRACS